MPVKPRSNLSFHCGVCVQRACALREVRGCGCMGLHHLDRLLLLCYGPGGVGGSGDGHFGAVLLYTVSYKRY